MTGNYLEVSGQLIDLDETMAFPLDFSIADMKDPQKRKRNLSKSISLPGTIANMRFFSSTYSLSLTDIEGDGVGFDFDPTQRVSARYYKNSILVFDGLFRLDEVVKFRGNYTFMCTLFSNFIDLFLSLGERTVSDLGWSEYNHELTIENIKKSWDTSVFVNGVETANFSAGEPLGFGYLYPLVDYGYNTIPSTFSINNLVPLVYAKEVIEKCFAVSGTGISSNWLESLRMRKMVYAFGGGNRTFLSSDVINARKVIAESDFQRTETEVGFRTSYDSSPETVKSYYHNELRNDGVALISTTSTNITTTVTQDDSSSLSLAKINIVGATGNYKIVFSGFIQQEMILAVGQSYYSGNNSLRIQFSINGQVIDTQTVWSYGGETTLGINYNKTFEFNIATNTVNTISLHVLRFTQIQIDGGDTIEFETTTPTPLSYTLTCENGALLDGDTINITPSIADMKAKDFLSDIIKAFNLYVSDPDVYNTVVVEPLGDFYEPTTEFDDWTKLVDEGREMKIIPASSISGKNYVFSFEDESDYQNQQYQNQFGQRYGNGLVTTESKFQTENREYKLRFGQAIPVQQVGSGIVLPVIKKPSSAGGFEPYAGKPKMYFYNGLKTGDFRITNVAGDTYEDLSEYPCVHHFDDFENPTFDWNFDLPKMVYYGDLSTIVTTNNLISEYHLKFIRELTGRDSRLYRLFVKLSAVQINTLSYSRLKMIDGVLFRLNEIKDFDSDIVESTFVELIRIIEADSPPTFTGGVSSSEAELVSVLSSPDGVGEDVGVISGGEGISMYSPIKQG